MEQFTYRDVYLFTEVLKDFFGIFTLTYYVILCLKLKRTNGTEIYIFVYWKASLTSGTLLHT